MSQPPPCPSSDGFAAFARLPPELQTIILRHALVPDPSEYLTHLGNGEPERAPLESKREQLKRIRLFSHVFHEAVTSAVFASVHMHPSRLSMRRAERVANSHLACYVKEIVHHQGSFANRDEDLNLFSSTLASNRRRNDYPRELQRKEGEVNYENFIEEIRAAYRFPADAAEFAESLRALLEKLPNLLTYVCLPYHDEWHDPETSAYTLRRTGLSYLPPPDGFGKVNHKIFLASISPFMPRRLDLSLFSCTDILLITSPFLKDELRMPDNQLDFRHHSATPTGAHFPHLVYLKVGPLYGTKYGWGEGVQSVLYCALTTLFKAGSNLRDLELTNDYPLARKFIKLPKDGLPRLWRLTISGGASAGQWPEESLALCIDNVAASLRHLHFNRIELKEWRHGASNSAGAEQHNNFLNAPSGALVRFLHHISKDTRLESCTGLETVKDIKSEHRRSRSAGTRAGPRPGKHVLLPKLAQAVCHRISWPMELPLAPDSYYQSHVPMDSATIGAMVGFVWSHWDDTIDEFELRAEQFQ